MREDVAPDARAAGDVSESREADVQDLPRNEAPRTRPLGGPDADPRAGETAAQDRTPSADDINLEATLLQRSTGRAGVDEWRQAERRFSPGLEDERGEAAPARGPSAGATTGRVVTERGNGGRRRGRCGCDRPQRGAHRQIRRPAPVTGSCRNCK